MRIKILFLINILVLFSWYFVSVNDDTTRVIFCDVGQGDGILVTKKNWQMLVDTGPNNKKILTCLENHMPFWDKTLEVVLITHSDSDHSGGLADVLKSYRTIDVFSNDELKSLVEQNISSKKLKQNDLLKMGLFNFEIVNPPNFEKNLDDNNNNSIAGILSYKATPSSRGGGTSEGQATRIFLSGDISKEVEQRLVWQTVLRQDSGPVNILKIAHHGSATATSDELLEVLKAKVAVISVGAKNRFGHPTKEVLDRLKNKGIKIRRTDEEGDVVIGLN